VTSLEWLWAGWRGEYIEAVSSESGPPPSDQERCVFCSILASGLSDADTLIVWRDPAEAVVAILNRYPYTSGHLMVMPVRHVGDLSELDTSESERLWSGVLQASTAVRRAYQPDGMNLGANLGRAAGAGVPGHLHLHVVPRWAGDTNFMTTVAGARVLPEALPVSAEKLRRAWPAD
jgi:diadenosine tetraphosphate (Ap4A) HIT family hydrolase